MQKNIIKSAISMTETKGIKFTLSDIAKSLKISKKTIYKYFNSKEELIYEAIKYIFNDIHNQISEISSQNINNFEKLRKVLAVYPTVINFETFKLNKLIENYPDIYKIIQEQFDIKWEQTLTLYDECLKDGLIKNIDREYFRLIMLGIYDRAIHLENHKQITEACIDAALNGFKK